MKDSAGETSDGDGVKVRWELPAKIGKLIHQRVEIAMMRTPDGHGL